MTNTKEKLIELLNAHKCPWLAGNVGCPTNCNNCIADHLIANGVTVQRWIPVTERLPGSKEKVLVYGGDTPTIYAGYTRGYDEGWFTWDDSKVISDVTHWMPLPELPKEG